MRVRLPFFFPLAFLLVAGMVWTALRPGVERTLEWRSSLSRAAQDGFTIDGDRLAVLTGTERASVAIAGTSANPFAVITSVGTVSETAADGVHYFLPVDAVRAINARAVDVTFEVRAPARGGAEMWLARCVMNGATDTGWIDFVGTPQWRAHTLRCPIDAAREQELDLMVWSDALGDGGRVELRRIRVTPARGEPGAGGDAAG